MRRERKSRRPSAATVCMCCLRLYSDSYRAEYFRRAVFASRPNVGNNRYCTEDIRSQIIPDGERMRACSGTAPPNEMIRFTEFRICAPAKIKSPGAARAASGRYTSRRIGGRCDTPGVVKDRTLFAYLLKSPLMRSNSFLSSLNGRVKSSR